MYDPRFGRSFNKHAAPKRFGYFAYFGCVVMALIICTAFKPRFHPQLISAAMSLQLSTSSGEQDMAVVKDIIISQPLVNEQLSSSASLEDQAIVKNKAISKPLQLSTSAGVENMAVVNDTIVSESLAAAVNLQLSPDNIISEPLELSTGASPGDMAVVEDTIVSKPATAAVNLQLSTSSGQEDVTIVNNTIISGPVESSSASNADVEGIAVVNDTIVSQPLAIRPLQIKAICRVSEPVSDYCDINGDIRVHPNSSTIFIASSRIDNISAENSTSWIIRPYARKGNVGAMQNVKPWTIKVVQSHENTPTCTSNHSFPAIFFSLGGYSGNHFHDLGDIVIPLYSTSRKFDGEVHFLATDYKSWWISKFRGILGKLSTHKVIDIDKEEGTQCYKSMIVGLKSRKELGIDTKMFQDEFSMKDFMKFLRSTYSLQRETAMTIKKGGKEKPRLMIISRKSSRILMNEQKVTKLAESLGFEVVIAEPTLSTNLTKFAELVNSCDVLVGVHGAGLTNMVFLPENAVLIQIVPLGIEGIAMRDFGDPAVDMNIRYLGYKIRARESSLIQDYSLNHEVIRNPLSLHRKGWDAIRSVYLDRQNVSVDVRRFRGTLLKALKLLHQ